MRFTCPALTVLLAVSTCASAAERVLELDPGQVKLQFQLEASTHEVHGSFALREGEVRFDAATGEARGRIVMDATSAQTGNEKRDRKMHEKVLESAAFPEFVFDVLRLDGSVEGDGEHDVTLVGKVRLHGATHDVSVLAHVQVSGDAVTAHAVVPIPYVEWGLKDPSIAFFRVAKVVQVSVDVTGRLHG